MDKTEVDTNLVINYNLPIFVCYVNVEGLSAQRAQQMIGEVVKNTHTPNLQMWYLASDRTAIECIYPGMKVDQFNDRMKVIIDRLASILDGFKDGSDKDDVIQKLKIQIKDIVLDNILDG